MTILLSRDTLAACHRLALDHYGPDDEMTEQLLELVSTNVSALD